MSDSMKAIMLTTKEAAELLGISHNTLAAYRRRNGPGDKVPPANAGICYRWYQVTIRTIRYRRDQLLEDFERNQTL